MNLQEIASQNLSVPLANLTDDINLVKEIQARLIELGCLDPPVDSDFGPVSKLVLRLFAEKVGEQPDGIIDAPLARALLDNTADTLFPLTLGNELASRIVRYMQMKGYWLARMPDFMNIIYIEGAEEDGTPNRDELNVFNDRRLILVIKDGKPRIILNFGCTTEPGRHFTLNPGENVGAARIAFGEYKAWRVGTHPQSRPSRLAHEALVQASVVPVHRDVDRNGIRPGDPVDVSAVFGINQHSAHDANPNNIGLHGAGCLVGRVHSEHREFMAACKKDPRYRRASNGYRFRTTVIAGDDLLRRTT